MKAQLNEVQRLQKIAGILKENIKENIDLTTIDSAVLKKYPNAKKQELPDDTFEGYPALAYYKILGVKGVAGIVVGQDENSVIYWETNKYDEPTNTWGEHNGEIINGELVDNIQEKEKYSN